MNDSCGARLTPAQQQAANCLLGGLPAGDVFVLRAKPGMGKTTVLRYLHAQAGGTLLGIRQFLEELMARGPEAIEESFLRVLDDALAKFDLVFVDDLHLITNVVENCDYQRTYLLDAALTAVLGEAAAQRKKLVFATAEESPWPIRRRAYSFEIGDFTPDDYAAVCRPYFQPEPPVNLDAARIHRFAPLLNAYQLRNACAWLAGECTADTDRLIEYLQSHNMTSNVELEEVAPVSWHDLKGVDDVIHALEAKVALPFENDELAARLGLKPKRGVLLAGPPGTGKTTIGRALAHRLKSKFFLIDGTVIAGSHDFYSRVREIFDAARRKRTGGSLHRRRRCDFRRSRRSRPVSIPADRTRRAGEHQRRARMRHDDRHECEQPAARAGTFRARGIVAGDAAAGSRGANLDPRGEIRRAAGGGRLGEHWQTRGGQPWIDPRRPEHCSRGREAPAGARSLYRQAAPSSGGLLSGSHRDCAGQSGQLRRPEAPGVQRGPVDLLDEPQSC